jgi:hypothetical protein
MFFERQINFLLFCSLCLSIQLERSWRKYNEQTRLKTILGQIACIWPLPKQSLHFLHLPRWQNHKWIAELSLCSGAGFSVMGSASNRSTSQLCLYLVEFFRSMWGKFSNRMWILKYWSTENPTIFLYMKKIWEYNR